MEINNNIQEKYCSLEVSKLLKEKGFGTPVQYCYDKNDELVLYKDVFVNFENHNTDASEKTSRPTHALAIEWIRVNLNWHFELIWDIFEGKLMWFYSLTQIGDLKKDSIDMKPMDSIEQANEEALLYILKNKHETKDKVQIDEIEYESIKDAVLKEYANGKVVICTFDGIHAMSLDDFVKQPASGMLYDLNRNEATVLTFIKDQKWINDYAVAKVIQKLKSQIEEYEKHLKDFNGVMHGITSKTESSFQELIAMLKAQKIALLTNLINKK